MTEYGFEEFSLRTVGPSAAFFDLDRTLISWLERLHVRIAAPIERG
jgi:hypothetical protein